MNARDITLVACSRGPLGKLHAYHDRMGWRFPWVSSEGSDFNYDFGASFDQGPKPDGVHYNFEPVSDELAGEVPGLTAFVLEDGIVYRTYSVHARGLESFDGAYRFIDRAPKGRQEDEYEYFPGEWWRRHDEYEGVAA